LCSANTDLLVTPRSRLVTYGDRVFSCVAPLLWNTLSLILWHAASENSFKHRLKTFLFNAPFDEARDDMDAYLEWYERFAKSQGWDEDDWAVCLSPLLTGKGLEVYASMPPEEAMDCEAMVRHDG
jgi:hypothetical protein